MSRGSRRNPSPWACQPGGEQRRTAKRAQQRIAHSPARVRAQRRGSRWRSPATTGAEGAVRARRRRPCRSYPDPARARSGPRHLPVLVLGRSERVPWAAPGGLLGLAAAQRAERAGGRLINTLGISVGLVTGIGLLVVVATLLAVGTGDEPASADRDPVPFVPVETESSAAPTGARPGRARAESSARSRTREDRRGLVQQRRAPDVCGHVCRALLRALDRQRVGWRASSDLARAARRGRTWLPELGRRRRSVPQVGRSSAEAAIRYAR